MSPKRLVAVALLVAAAGCTGAGAPNATDTTTTEAPTTAPHTAVGTSHAGQHLTVTGLVQAGNVTVTLAPDGDAETFDVPAGQELDLTREIHDRGHDVRAVVRREGDVVFDQTVGGAEYYDVVVDENDTRVTQTVV